MLNFILGTISLLLSVLLIPVPNEFDCWAATAIFAPLVRQREKYSSSSLWRNSPISYFGLLYIVSPHLSIHCFSLPVFYAQYFLRNLLYRLIPSTRSFRFAYKFFFSRTTLHNILLYCTYVQYVLPTVAI